MRRPDFRFAALIAAGMAAATVAVAVLWDLPIRDPDGVGHTFVILPLVLLGTVFIDIVPRSVWRARHDWRTLPAQLTGVVRERWGRKHIVFAASGLGTWYVTYAAFRNLKSYVPFVNDHLWDNKLAAIDRLLFFGHQPGPLLHDVLGTGWANEFFSLIYILWIGFVPGSLAVALVWSRRTGSGAWYVTAIAVDWVLGEIVYFLVPSLGPAYSSPEDFASLPHTWNTSLIDGLWDDRVAVLSDPNAATQVQTIAAFASLHVAIMVTACLMARLLGLGRAWQVLSWVFLALTVLATVYLGWHFFVDTLAGAVVGAAAVWIAALGTGNHVRGVPRLVETELVQPNAERISSA